MKKIFYIIIIVSTISFAQGIGELAPEKPPEIFPNNSIGMNIIFSEGGFGLGGFYRRHIWDDLTFFTDFSITEAKDDQEFEYIDPFTGQTYTNGKKNRVLLLPLNFGLQYRLFSRTIGENLRPFINAGVGPTMAVTTPYEMEFFDSFKKARAHYALGSYVGFGADFGLDKKSLMGISFKYYFIHFFDEGVESLFNKKKTDFNGFILSINLGLMF